MKASVVRGAVLAGVAVLAWPAAHVAARGDQQEGQKTIYVSVLDDSGKPVKDMTADEFALREDGKDRKIVSIGPAVAPLDVVVLVDTNDSAMRMTQDIHNAVMAFIRELHSVRKDAEVELMEFGQAPVPATSFITSDEALERALSKMVPKPGADAVLMEAIAQANGDLEKRPSTRRAIVSVNVEPSQEELGNRKRIADSFQKSNAQLWALSVQSHDVTLSSRKGASASANAGNITASRNALLQELSKASGGERNMIDAASAMENILKQWADDLTYQYQIVYTRDGGAAKVLQVGTTRAGVHLHASGFPPK